RMLTCDAHGPVRDTFTPGAASSASATLTGWKRTSFERSRRTDVADVRSGPRRLSPTTRTSGSAGTGAATPRCRVESRATGAGAVAGTGFGRVLSDPALSAATSGSPGEAFTTFAPNSAVTSAVAHTASRTRGACTAPSIGRTAKSGLFGE